MVYDSYVDLRVYSSQTKIMLPKSSSDRQLGKGNVVFLLTPNLTKGLSVLSDPTIGFQVNLYKYFTADMYYKGRFGTKMVISNERNKLMKFYGENKELPMAFRATTIIKPIIDSKRNLVVDMSRWIELFFTYRKTNNIKTMCKSFLDLTFSKINDSRFNAYSSKLLLIDLNSWCTAADCVLMNRKLLNNPLSILFYTAYHYPDLLAQYPNIRIMVANRSARQVILFNFKDITKRNFPKIKSKLKMLKNIVFSVEDETSTEEMSDEEVKAEIVQDFKDTMKASLKKNLLGNDEDDIPNPFDEDDNTIDPFEEPVEDLTTELEDAYTDDNTIISDDTMDDDPLVDEIESIVESEVEKMIDTVNEDDIFADPKEIAKKKADELKKRVYKSSFMPERTPEQIAKVERLTANQRKVLDTPSRQDVKKKTIDVVQVTPNIENTNPNLTEIKFANFDKNYVDKCLESDIDNSVAILAQADHKIFVVSKEVEDTSDTQNLKKTYTYHLEDEKGNKSTIKLDIPVVLDGSYIFINGSKKLIGHQFILKPLVKTSADTVQLVTAYNKVFIRRHGQVDRIVNQLISYLLDKKNIAKYNVKEGNFAMMNKEFDPPIDFNMFAKRFSEFTINDKHFIIDLNALLEYAKRKSPKYKKPDLIHELPIAFDENTKQLITIKRTEQFTDYIISILTPEELKGLRKIKRKPRLVVANAKIYGKDIPAILFMMYCEGFKSVMEKANIEYKFITPEEFKKLDLLYWDYIQLEDSILVWRSKNLPTAMLMNGMKNIGFEMFTQEELESKDTYASILLKLYGSVKALYALDNFKDFLLDEKSKEILEDFGYPTDLISVLIVAVNMLGDNSFSPENNMENMRIRSAEVIADLVYILLTSGYTDYRTTANKKKPTQIAIKQSAVIDALLSSSIQKKRGKTSVATNLVAESSVLNPVLELEKIRAVTFKGIRGIQLDRALTIDKRVYDPTMLGVIAMSTSPDGNVGVVRELTLEPNITSTRGYIETTPADNIEDIPGTALFGASELLTPLGVQHDDPDRTAMSYKQTKYMISVEDSDPVLIGNRVEAVTPYYLTDEFVVDAKYDGEVIDVKEGYVVVKYSNGENYAIDIAPRIRKNSSAGFFVDNSLTCNLKVGDKFNKGDILAYNDKAFTKHDDDPGASMNLGVLTKIAITSSWDIYEDSTPITHSLAERLATTMIDEKPVVLNTNAMIDYIVQPGQKIKAGEKLIKFVNSESDTIQTIFDSMRDKDMSDEISEDIKNTIDSKFTGEIADVQIYTTVPLSELHESVAKVVKQYQNRVNKRNKVLDKYSNPNDLKHYKAGQIITETSEIVKPGKNGRIKGNYIEQGVLIIFYIKYKDIAAKGDKICANFALKGVCSHVIDEGLEPYSEYRPDEEISTIIAPLAVAARKTPSIFLAMFGNKLLIEAKRQLRDIYLED